MDKQFLGALSAIIREQVSNKNEVHIEGIGSFYIEHEKQFQKKFDNGQVVMMPPKDSIRFSSEN